MKETDAFPLFKAIDRLLEDRADRGHPVPTPALKPTSVTANSANRVRACFCRPQRKWTSTCHAHG